jgi:hypothetical protein
VRSTAGTTWVVFEPNDEPLRVKLPLKPAELVIVTIAQLVAASG